MFAKTVKFVSVSALIGLAASCGPSPEVVARFNAYEAQIWQCSATNGGRKKLALAEKYRKAGGTKSHMLVVVPSDTTSADDAARINQCVFSAVGTPPITPSAPQYYNNVVYPNATPASRGKALELDESAEYLKSFEGQAGINGQIVANPSVANSSGRITNQMVYNPSSTPAASTAATSAVSAVATTVPRQTATASFGCPKHADVLHGGKQYCTR